MGRRWALAVFVALWAVAGARAVAAPRPEAPHPEEERYQAAFTDGSHVLLVTDDDRVRTVVPKPYKNGDAVAVSPDGRSIAYTSFDDASGYELLYLASAPDFVGREIGAKNSWHRDPTFSADGKKVLFSLHPNAHWSERFQPGKSAQLFEVDLQTLDLKQLTSNGACHHHPTYSRSDDSIYFTKTNCQTSWNIARFDPKTGEERLLTQGVRYDNHPVTSPDGKWLAYARRRRSGETVIVRDLTTGHERLLQPRITEISVQLEWARNSEVLLFWSGHLVWKLPLDGHRPMALREGT